MSRTKRGVMFVSGVFGLLTSFVMGNFPIALPAHMSYLRVFLILCGVYLLARAAFARPTGS